MDFRIGCFQWVLLLAALLPCPTLAGQTPGPGGMPEKQYEQFDFTPVPKFRGGDTAAVRFLTKQLNLPRNTGVFRQNDTVVVSFVAQKGGFISDIKAVRGKHRRLKQAVVDAVVSMPLFSAAESAGFHPRILYCVAVVFKRRRSATPAPTVYFFRAGAKSMYYDKEWMSWVRIR